VFFLFLVGTTLLFAGEPLGPSRRVSVHWKRASAGRLRRFFGPGVARACTLLAALGLAGLGLLSGVAAVWVGVGASGTRAQAVAIGAVSAHLAAFFVFLVGLTTWLRGRCTSGGAPRLLVLAVVFVFGVGPWIVMAIAGVLAKGDDRILLMAAPSPAYAAVLYETLAVHPLTGRDGVVSAAMITGAAFLLGGLALALTGNLHIRRRLADERRFAEQWGRPDASSSEATLPEAAPPEPAASDPAPSASPP
jgi:hypothetical protein